MKTRNGYVSNSSSSSFVILNWSKLTDEQKQLILDYKRQALRVWSEKGIRLRFGANGMMFEPAYRKSNEEYSEDDGILDIDDPLDFGMVEPNYSCSWTFREDKKNGVLDMYTVMGNFNMDKWMDYNGCFEYRYAGDNPQFDINTYSLKAMDVAVFTRNKASNG